MYGTNPLDNDTDGDMMPDFYEFHRGWNETNDNWSSFLKIQVQWIEVTPQNWKPIQFSDGQITRPQLDWTWFTHDATDPSDATQDADNDGEWECSGGVCDYVPYNNFQEYYAVVNATLSSPSIVRASALFDCSGEDVEEWFFRVHEPLPKQVEEPDFGSAQIRPTNCHHDGWCNEGEQGN